MSENRLTGEFDDSGAGRTPPMRSVFRRFRPNGESPDERRADEATPTVASVEDSTTVTAEPETVEVPMTDAARHLLRAKRADAVPSFLIWEAVLLAVAAWSLTLGGMAQLGIFCLLLAAVRAFGFWRTLSGANADLPDASFLRTTAVGEISRRDGRHSKTYYLDLGPVKLTITHPECLNRDVRHIVDGAPRTIPLVGGKKVAFKDRLLSADYTRHGRELLELRDEAGVALYRHPEYRPADAPGTFARTWSRSLTRLLLGNLVLLLLVPTAMAAFFVATMLNSAGNFQSDAFAFLIFSFFFCVIGLAWYASVVVIPRMWRTHPVGVWVPVAVLCVVMYGGYQYLSPNLEPLWLPPSQRLVLGAAPWRVAENVLYQTTASGASRAVGETEVEIKREGNLWVLVRRPKNAFWETVQFDAISYKPVLWRQSSNTTTTTMTVEGNTIVARNDTFSPKSATLSDYTLLAAQVTTVLRALPFAEGYERRFAAVYCLNCGTYQTGIWKVSATARVIGKERITVPAGTFEAWQVEIQMGSQVDRAWYQTDSPHYLVKYMDWHGVGELVKVDGE